MRQHRLPLRGLGDDRFAEAVIAGQERGDAARIVGLFVGAEEQRRIALRHLRGRHQRRCRTLDVAGAQANRAVRGHPQHMRIGRPRRRRRHRIQVHVEHPRGRAAHGEERHRTGAVIGHLDAEAGQLRAQVVEDAAGADLARWIAGIERDQRFEVAQGAGKQVAHARLISAHRVELMPNSLMKPSASSTPQSADCA
jgi:hypothetical protein